MWFIWLLSQIAISTYIRGFMVKVHYNLLFLHSFIAAGWIFQSIVLTLVDQTTICTLHNVQFPGHFHICLISSSPCDMCLIVMWQHGFSNMIGFRNLCNWFSRLCLLPFLSRVADILVGQCAEMHFLRKKRKKLLARIILSWSCDIRTKNNWEKENPKRLYLGLGQNDLLKRKYFYNRERTISYYLCCVRGYLFLRTRLF